MPPKAAANTRLCARAYLLERREAEADLSVVRVATRTAPVSPRRIVCSMGGRCPHPARPVPIRARTRPAPARAWLAGAVCTQVHRRQRALGGITATSLTNLVGPCPAFARAHSSVNRPR